VKPDRIQPMSGMVDAFVCIRGDVERTLYWRELWSKVTDETKCEISGAVKGFLEVES